jgi:cytochrome P450
MANIYSKSHILGSPAMSAITQEIVYNRLMPFLETEPQVEVHSLWNAVTMDFITAYLFGLSSGSNFVQDLKKRDHFQELYHSRHNHFFWPSELPGVAAFLKKWCMINVVPTWVNANNTEIEDWCLAMCANAEDKLLKAQASGTVLAPGDEPTVYGRLFTNAESTRNKEDPSSRLQQRKAIASEMLDQIGAGHETSAVILTYLTHELSLNPELQRRLRSEYVSAHTSHSDPSSMTPPDPKALDTLPLLQAILQETLRIHASIPGKQPRVVPSKGAELCEYFVPGGTVVSAQAYTLHRNETVFGGDVEVWDVSRWEDGGRESKSVEEKHRWMWAFGSGGRMCVGSHLAIYEIKSLVAAVYGRFTTRVVDDEGIEAMDRYTTGPKSNKLVLKFDKVQ